MVAPPDPDIEDDDEGPETDAVELQFVARKYTAATVTQLDNHPCFLVNMTTPQFQGPRARKVPTFRCPESSLIQMSVLLPDTQPLAV
jgi:hypothetical protein